ncbi:MAG: hypothetical protein JRI36_12985 [Deltaproteobacteria bacterium]|nr:hypothetical protein [Deltaproteobacteria bacterium]
MKEQIMSRPRLQEIIEKYGLYEKIRAKATLSDAIKTMKEHIEVEVKEVRGRNQAPASFEVSFDGEDPAKVRDVTAAIANLFIEDNLRLRERQAAGTSEFLERELERMKNVLREKEELVRKFKEENMGLLPEQMENNHRILAQLQQQLDSLNANLQQTEDRKVLLQGQLARMETLQPGSQAQGAQAGAAVENSAELSLSELRRQLENLETRYSEKHPDVIRLAATIKKREKEQENAVQADTPSPQISASDLSDSDRVLLAQREDLKIQLKLINKEILALRKEKENTEKEVEEYRRRIEDGPKIEQMFVDLRRGYDEATANYQSLLEKRLQAELAENLEKTQKGEQFRVLEPANLPEKPYKPDIMKILAMGLILGMGCGLGLVFLREYMDPTFCDDKELAGMIGLPVLISVPEVKTKTELRWCRAKGLGTIGILVFMASGLCYALFVLWKMDPRVFPIPFG